MPDQQLATQLHSLQQAYDRNDLPATGKQLTVLKIALARVGLLFPSPDNDKEDLAVARSILEVGAFYSLAIKDVKAFERYEAMLTVYYRDLSHLLPSSPLRRPILGLALLSHLSTSRISQFHTMLEELSTSANAEDADILNDVYIRWPVELERSLMEGSYTKAWRAKSRAPRKEYEVLAEGLMGTIRNDIASCHEKAYQSLPLAEASRLLFFNDETEAAEFGQQRGWTFSPTTKVFTFPKSTTDGIEGSEATSGDQLEKRGLVRKALEYATELEAIV
ncbi:regulatory particle non-ATPase [Naganishia albida]|nr:regulatory particle non-ATPase [Naganishia albida]